MQTFTLPKLVGRVGQIARIATFLSALAPGKGWVVEIKELRAERSSAQCRYLNGVAYKILGDATGYERDEVSEYLCGAYWGWRDKRVPKTPRNPEGIESVPMRTTTTDENGARCVLAKMEFCDYVAFVQRFAAKKGIHIPDPDEMEEVERAAA